MIYLPNVLLGVSFLSHVRALHLQESMYLLQKIIVVDMVGCSFGLQYMEEHAPSAESGVHNNTVVNKYMLITVQPMRMQVHCRAFRLIVSIDVLY